MKTTDFSRPVTSDKLMENLKKQFGSTVNIQNYSREKLEDIRNKFRTKIFQQEGQAGINDLLANETYQRDKAMLELLNTRIKEMLGEQMKQLRDKMSQLSEGKKDKPDFLDMDHDGNTSEPMKQATKTNKPWTDKSGKTHSGTAVKGKGYTGAAAEKEAKSKKVKESLEAFKSNVRFVNESIGYLLNEDEESKAKTITAAGDMVNDFTSWMQRVGQFQTKSMIELADAIRSDFGMAESEAFKQSVGPALHATLEVLTQQREMISNAVATLAGEAVQAEPMGMEPDMGTDLEPGMDTSAPDDLNTVPDDEFGASDAAAGVGTTGRAMRESRAQVAARKLAESHSIISKLAQ